MEGASRSPVADFCICRSLTTLAEQEIVLDTARFRKIQKMEEAIWYNEQLTVIVLASGVIEDACLFVRSTLVRSMT
jgi:hypothetical protein